MAPEKDERPAAAAKKPSETGAGTEDSTKKTTGTATPTAPLRPGPSAQGESPAQRESGNGGRAAFTAPPPASRRERYVIGSRAVAEQPFGRPRQSCSMSDVVEYLNHQDNVEVVSRLKLGSTQPFAPDRSTVSEVVVAKIDPGKAQRLQSVAPADLVIERDPLLMCAHFLSSTGWLAPIATLLPLHSVEFEVVVRVIGEGEQPLAGATVVLEGAGLPSQGLTDETGTARIAYFGDSIEAIQTLFVRSAANHWDRLIRAPRLSSGINTVKLRPLSDVYPNFPGARLVGWGQRLMGIDPDNARFSGSGVRIGLIDSGCDTSHPLLRHITRGRDFTAGGTESSWTRDPLAHGTHSAGIINALRSGQGVAGCAPDAELHVFKVAPGGRISDLLAALDECIERELDLISIGVVSEGFSELVSQKLLQARRAGITCIASAGNTGGPLAFPATLPGALAVAAVGRIREFPGDSSHALSVIPQLVGDDGLFPASFSGFGPQVAVSAPGVAIVSTAPGGGYAASDRTSAAAAHVTGLAALILAHHPLFREEPFRVRSEQRVRALFELIRASAVPYVSDPQRGGAGVPNLLRVPLSQGLFMGLPTAESPEHISMSPYWPASAQRWWPTAAGLF
jgi:subtilisin